MSQQRRDRYVAAMERPTELPSMYQLCPDVSRLDQQAHAEDVQLRALERLTTGLGTTAARLLPLSDAAAQLNSLVTSTKGLAGHLDNQTERMESALKNIADRQDTDQVIAKGVRLTHKEAIHRLLIHISDLEGENTQGVTTQGHEEANMSRKTNKSPKTRSPRSATSRPNSRSRKSSLEAQIDVSSDFSVYHSSDGHCSDDRESCSDDSSADERRWSLKSKIRRHHW